MKQLNQIQEIHLFFTLQAQHIKVFYANIHGIHIIIIWRNGALPRRIDIQISSIQCQQMNINGKLVNEINLLIKVFQFIYKIQCLLKTQNCKNKSDDVVFLNPSELEKGPSFALMNSAILDDQLEENDLQIIWFIGGEKQIFNQRGNVTQRLEYNCVYTFIDGIGKEEKWAEQIHFETSQNQILKKGTMILRWLYLKSSFLLIIIQIKVTNNFVIMEQVVIYRGNQNYIVKRVFLYILKSTFMSPCFRKNSKLLLMDTQLGIQSDKAKMKVFFTEKQTVHKFYTQHPTNPVISTSRRVLTSTPGTYIGSDR